MCLFEKRYSTFVCCSLGNLAEKRRSSEQEASSKRTNEVMYGHNQRKSIPHEEQYYSGLPCPPTCTPGKKICLFLKTILLCYKKAEKTVSKFVCKLEKAIPLLWTHCLSLLFAYLTTKYFYVVIK